MEPNADYFLDLYGRCHMPPPCACLKPGAQWLGRLCQYWEPIGFTSPAEHLAWFMSGAPQENCLKYLLPKEK